MHEDHWSLNDSGDFRIERSYRAIRRYFLVCISDSWYHRNPFLEALFRYAWQFFEEPLYQKPRCVQRLDSGENIVHNKTIHLETLVQLSRLNR